MKQTTFFAVLACFFALLAGCGESEEAKTAEKSAENGAAASADAEVAASVNGEPIPESRVSIYTSGGAKRDAAIDNLITSELIAQAAKKAGMHEKPEIAEQLAVAEQTVLGRAYAEEFFGKAALDESKVQARYDELLAQFDKSYEYQSSHILVKDEAQAKDLYAQVSEDPEKFAALAQEHSLDTGSGAQGGALGWVGVDALVPEYGAALTATEPGNLADAPVKTQYGWHIIYVAEKRPIAVPDLDESMRQRLRQAIQAEEFSLHIEELRKKAEITRP
ncbi:MAG: peptidylprolyl isomerase [Gammaproteobacteria bacterium]